LFVWNERGDFLPSFILFFLSMLDQGLSFQLCE
jgi:hypothetical protein